MTTPCCSSKRQAVCQRGPPLTLLAAAPTLRIVIRVVSGQREPVRMVNDSSVAQPRTMYEEVFGTPAERRERARRRLSIVRWLALADLLLLVALTAASFA